MRKFWITLGIFAALSLWALLSPGSMAGRHAPPATGGIQQATANMPQEIAVPPPPFSEDIYPCSACHADMEPNLERRQLEEFHDDIVLDHDEENRWCMACHDAENRDILHSASGEPIAFEESYKLCGQCHGPKLRDWKAGIHGRRSGEWNGRKEYLLCAHCHDPHAPRFKSLTPEAAPQKPGKKK